MLRDWPETLPATGDKTYGANSSPRRERCHSTEQTTLPGVVCSLKEEFEMTRTVHIIDSAFKSRGKRQLMACSTCEAETLHTTPFFGYPFRCVADHDGTSRCDSCETYVDHVAKIVVDGDGRYESFCDLCCEADSPKKERRVAGRKRKAAEDAHKPIDLDDPQSIARALGASSFIRR